MTVLLNRPGARRSQKAHWLSILLEAVPTVEGAFAVLLPSCTDLAMVARLRDKQPERVVVRPGCEQRLVRRPLRGRPVTTLATYIDAYSAL